MKIKLNFRKILKIIFALLVIGITLLILGYVVVLNADYGEEYNNSMYESDYMKHKKVMIVVPHEDDEINVAGTTIKNYIDNGSEVAVMFVTNGDYNGLGEVRINEAIKSVQNLGVKKENLYFLGYGDQWDNKNYIHIYNAPDNEVIKSHIGKNRTYGNDQIKDYRTGLDGKGSLYTRNNLKKDMKDAIIEFYPDIIFAVDFDFHIDHRATSLIFEEVLAEILKADTKYNPKVYKGFAYNTAWNGKDDFYMLNLQSTNKPNKSNLQDSNYELDLPNYNWDDRVIFLIPKDCLTYTKLSNPIYKSLKDHKSQKAKLQFGQVMNSDQVFWERETDSITYNADVEVSSGVKEYINDFKLADTTHIDVKNNVFFDKSVWIPKKDDKEKKVKIIFETPKDIESVSLYDNQSLCDNIILGKLKFSDGSEEEVSNIKKNGSETIVNFSKKRNIKFVEFAIEKYEGENPGLCELEIYENKRKSMPEFIKLYSKNRNETFMYRYIVTKGEDIPIDVYSYPDLYKEDIYDKCNIEIMDNKKNSITLKDKNIHISKDAKPGHYKIRVELREDENIFDEIELIIPNSIEKIYLNYIDDLEKFYFKIPEYIRYKLGLEE